VQAPDFEQWYFDEHARLVHSLFVLSGSLDVARDAADEAFARALENWGRVATMRSPAGWTYRVAVNVLRRSMRRRKQEAVLLSKTAPSRAAEPVELPDREVWNAVSRLGRRQREVIVLRYIADLSEADIASALRRRRGTVASDLSRARAALSRLLPDVYTTEGNSS
jgi:RNA polymerase sigma factor (sigma-70 family)